MLNVLTRTGDRVAEALLDPRKNTEPMSRSCWYIVDHGCDSGSRTVCDDGFSQCTSILI